MEKIYAGMDLGGTLIKYGLCRADGSIVSARVTEARADKGPESLLKQLADCARVLISEAREMNAGFNYVGLGTPGTVDHDTGKVVGVSPNIPGWDRVNPKEFLETELGISVCIDNDANAVALAEYLFGAARGFSDILAVTVGTGVGGGLILDGRLYRGAYGAAGEIGHVTVVEGGDRCNCGKFGCMERYASAAKLIFLATEFARSESDESSLRKKLDLGGRLTVGDIFSAAYHNSDSAAQRAVSSCVDYLATGLASVMAIIDPQLVVIGGGLSDAGGEPYIAEIESALRKRSIGPGSELFRVAKAQLGNQAGFVGAAMLGERQ
jgi:glucokinase